MTMRLLDCSLKTGGALSITPNAYTLVRFPFTTEPYDPDDLHPPVQPDTGNTITSADPRAGLIWPRHDALGRFTAMMQWQDIADLASADRPTHFRHRFVRDPLGLPGSTGYDSTATSDHRPRPAGEGGTCKTKQWEFWVHPETPLGYLVYHDARVPMRLELAEFKLSYWVDVP